MTSRFKFLKVYSSAAQCFGLSSVTVSWIMDIFEPNSLPCVSYSCSLTEESALNQKPYSNNGTILLSFMFFNRGLFSQIRLALSLAPMLFF